ncbi:MAG: hypothetical protein ACXWT1_20020 [Methylobacter sp.]
MKHPIMVLDPIRTSALKLHYYPANSLQPGISAWMLLPHLALANGLNAAELNSLFWPSVNYRKPRPFDYDLNLPNWRVKHPGTPLQDAYNSLQAATGFSSGHPMSEYQDTKFEILCRMPCTGYPFTDFSMELYFRLPTTSLTADDTLPPVPATGSLSVQCGYLQTSRPLPQLSWCHDGHHHCGPAQSPNAKNVPKFVGFYTVPTAISQKVRRIQIYNWLRLLV